jgi:hypothetical protein
VGVRMCVHVCVYVCVRVCRVQRLEVTGQSLGCRDHRAGCTGLDGGGGGKGDKEEEETWLLWEDTRLDDESWFWQKFSKVSGGHNSNGEFRKKHAFENFQVR